MAQCKKCGNIQQAKDLEDGVCEKCRDISPEEEYKYTEDSEYNEEEDAILIQSIVDNANKEIETRENTQYITRVISTVLTIGMFFFFFHVITLVASEEKVENETAQKALDVISIGINPAIIGVPLVINSTVDCDQEMAKHALALALKDEVSSKKVSLVSNPYGYVGHISFFNDIKMLKMDNLKTYCQAYVESPYGNIPIEYTTQKAGFLEVYVEVANVR